MLFISMHDTYRPNKVIKINGNMFIHCECARNNVSNGEREKDEMDTSSLYWSEQMI